MINSLRFTLIRLLVWLLNLLSTDKADPSDLAYCYRLLLDRMPDPAGWQLHLRSIRSGFPRRALVAGFLDSAEFQSLHGQAQVQTVDTGAFRMAVDAEDPYIAPGIIAGQGYEPHVTAALLRELKPDSVFVDLGANMGWFSLTAAAVAKQGQVVAIEPNYGNVQLLYRSLIANHFDNVRVLPFAVSDRPTRLRLNFVRSNGYVSPADDQVGGGTIVEGEALDTLLGEIARVDILKMDIEGYEPVALRGMAGTLRRCRPVLLCEFHPAMIRANSGVEPAAFLNSLVELGYQLAVIRPDGSESPPMDAAGILGEWERLNREHNAGDLMHLDLIGRPHSMARE
mgnify:CR=1 FL=1